MRSLLPRRLTKALAALVVGALLFGAGAGAAHAHHEGPEHELCVYCPLAHQSATESANLTTLFKDDAPAKRVFLDSSSDHSIVGSAPAASRGPPANDSSQQR